MNTNKLYLVREIDEPNFRQEVLPAIQAWLDVTPFCPIKTWTENTLYISSSEIPDYSAKTIAVVDERSLSEVHRPFRGAEIVGGKTIDQIDVWTDVSITLKGDGSSNKQHYDVPHTDSVRTCHDCSGRGEVTCDGCSGSGKVRCGRCRGAGTEEESYEESEQAVCTSCTGGYNGKQVCGRCNGSRWCVKQVTKTRRITCTRCAGRGDLTCSTCGGSGKVTCPTCEGARDLHWWVQCTSSESSSEVIFTYNGQNKYDSEKSLAKYKDISLLNSIEGSYIVEGFSDLKGSYEEFANLLDVSSLDVHDELKTWIVDYLNEVKKQNEVAYGIRVAFLSHTISRIPLVLHIYKYSGTEYKQWINLITKKVEDHDGPIAQAASNSLSEAKKEYDAGALEKALVLAQKAVVIGDTTTEECDMRNSIQWSIYLKYLLAAIPSALIALGLTCFWGDIQSILIFGAVGSLVSWALLLLMRDMLLVPGTSTSLDRLIYGSLVGFGLTVIGVFQPYVLFVLSVAAIVIFFKSSGLNLRKPEELRAKRPDISAKELEAIVESLAFSKQSAKKAYTYSIGLAVLACIIYALAIVGYKLYDGNGSPSILQSILNQRLTKNVLLVIAQRPSQPEVLNVPAIAESGTQPSEAKANPQPEPESEAERAIRLPISAEIQRGNLKSAIAMLATLSEMQKIRILENDETMALPLGVMRKQYEKSISVINIITDQKIRELVLEDIREMQATDLIESNQMDKALLVIENIKDGSRSERLKQLIEEKMPKAELKGF